MNKILVLGLLSLSLINPILSNVSENKVETSESKKQEKSKPKDSKIKKIAAIGATIAGCAVIAYLFWENNNLKIAINKLNTDGAADRGRIVILENYTQDAETKLRRLMIAQGLIQE